MAAGKVYKHLAKTYFYTVDTQPIGGFELPTPDGEKTVYVTTGGGHMVSSDSPGGQKEARRKMEEMKALIARGEYKLLKTTELGSGETTYDYLFILSDGEELSWNFMLPLKGISSWDAYQDALRQKESKRMESIKEAIFAGRFRLLDVDVFKQHICQDQGSEDKIRVLQIHRPDGKVEALVRPYLPQPSVEMYSMSWDDHLREIAEGRRKLIKLETIPSYTYEITLADGTTTKWNYGDGDALVKPE